MTDRFKTFLAGSPYRMKGDQIADWTKSVAEIDRQLYAKYKLTKDEIAFVESMIKPME